MTIRDVTRLAVREEVLRQAWRLFAEQGFAATTIDQIAEAAGMSRRTFFRYFSNKDELLQAKLLQSVERLADALKARPADEAAWVAVRRALDVVVDSGEMFAADSRALQRMLCEEPAARANNEERRRYWNELFGPLIAARLAPGGDLHLRATALASAAFGCLDAAQEAWLHKPEASLSELLDAAMSAIEQLS
ncbi:TetR family transcriptional regulator [Streptomyces sp. NPDC094034]|uniref:TetR family transcriptional regulator n=1 Tax=Streptomyces sp. NPDC094034 TaxID=3155309 RepID=UPI00333403A2